MLYILVHEPYKTTYSWKKRLKYITAEARKKRVEIAQIEDISQIPADDSQPILLLRSAAKYWITNMVEQANARSIQVVVMANLPPDHGLTCSVICENMDESTRLAIEYLRSLGKKSLALFGVNPTAYSDPYRARIFCEYFQTDKGVYYMADSFSSASEHFLRDIDQYDGVIICNAATAIGLMLRLKEYIKDHPDFYIMTFGKLFLLDYCCPKISSVAEKFDEIGPMLFSLCDLLWRHKQIRKATIYTGSTLRIGETTGGQNMKEVPSLPNPRPKDKQFNPYLEDKEISEIIRVEAMLQDSDQTDMDILFGLLEGMSYQQLSEKCFLSLTAVKYRVKQMEKKCHQATMPDLRALLKRYFS